MAKERFGATPLPTVVRLGLVSISPTPADPTPTWSRPGRRGGPAGGAAGAPADIRGGGAPGAGRGRARIFKQPKLSCRRTGAARWTVHKTAGLPPHLRRLHMLMMLGGCQMRTDFIKCARRSFPRHKLFFSAARAAHNRIFVAAHPWRT